MRFIIDAHLPAGKSWFLGIGINDYQHLPRLNNVVRDIKAILETIGAGSLV